MDFAVGNRGLNSVYQATTREPTLYCYSPEERRGQLTYYKNGRVFPFERRAAAEAEDPSIGERFPTAHDYARTTLEELRGEAWMASAEWLKTTTFESNGWVNGGGGTFECCCL